MKSTNCPRPREIVGFGGLIPDTVKGKILAEIARSPLCDYTPSTMARMIGSSQKQTQEALHELADEGLVQIKGMRGSQKVYEVCRGSSRLVALNLLRLAVEDDVSNERSMDAAIFDYIESLGFKIDDDNLIKKRTVEHNNETAPFTSMVTDENSWRLTKCMLY